jgi:hypothetical protein
MDAKQILKELIQSVDEVDLYNFLLCFSSIGMQNEIDDKIDHEETRHDQINAWIDRAIEVAYEKSKENDRPNIEGMLGLLG